MVILGLGSNMGDRAGNLQAAVRALSGMVSGLQASAMYSVPAMLPPDAPRQWDIPFLNMAVCGRTALSPQALLKQVKALEQTLGRISRGHWGPREIDIDIVAMDDIIIDTPGLRIPHCGLLERDFVLVPLAEICPDWRYPVAGEFYGRRAADICAQKGFVLERAVP